MLEENLGFYREQLSKSLSNFKIMNEVAANIFQARAIFKDKLDLFYQAFPDYVTALNQLQYCLQTNVISTQEYHEIATRMLLKTLNLEYPPKPNLILNS